MKVRHLKRRVRPSEVNVLCRSFLRLRAEVLHSQQMIVDKVLRPTLEKLLEQLVSNPLFAGPALGGSTSGNTN